MAATVVGALKDLIVAWGQVGARVWVDDAPQNATFPYVTLVDAVATTPALEGDAKALRLARILQVDLWQRQRDESYTLPGALFRALDGVKLVLAGAPAPAVTRIRVRDTQRLPDPELDIVHHALTIGVSHDPAAV